MINELRGKIEKNIEELKKTFKVKSQNYFFTEKELHSYFYHQCQEDNFNYKDYSLLHTEYPTPFKCRINKVAPYIEKAFDKDKQQRAHIDMVVLNPNFIDWVYENVHKDPHKVINSIGNARFDIYIKKFRKYYDCFADSYKESILLYAIEFKYLRHTYTGEKYSLINLNQDIDKLMILKKETMGISQIPYCAKIKSLVFIGDRISVKIKKSIIDIGRTNKEVCIIIDHSN